VRGLPEGLPEDLVVVDCSECGCLLVTRIEQHHVEDRAVDPARLPPVIAGRIKGRPYCDACLGRSGTPGPRGEGPAKADRDYHGGMFNRGEW